MRKPTRRAFLEDTATLAAAAVVASTAPTTLADPATTRQASGVKVGELTDNSAVVWMRLTAAAQRNATGPLLNGHTARKPKDAPPLTTPIDECRGACPGAPGRVRLRYATRDDLSDAVATDWAAVTDQTDFSHQHRLANLKPATRYYFAAETADDHGVHAPLRGSFETAPRPADPTNLTFCVQTCQGYCDLDHPDGYHIYPAMAAVAPKFIVFTGDNVYYDNDEPLAVNPRIARFHWERMYSLPRHVQALLTCPGYWEKDDHDTLNNDSWPGMKQGQLTFAEGQQIFRQQCPIPADAKPYRTFRWGKDLQIWLTDGRDFRSPNKQPDGPDKTIWGAEQKAWLKHTLAESDATWKVLISPTPIVGPDRGNKNDNHANVGFTHEGDEFRNWVKENLPKDRFFTCCGDRHWQYHSVHPKTALREFSCGPASDAHGSGSPGPDPEYHQFHRVKGGFLTVTVKPADAHSTILFEHRDVKGQVVHAWGAKSA